MTARVGGGARLVKSTATAERVEAAPEPSHPLTSVVGPGPRPCPVAVKES
jgi:hypothetical protein